MSESPGADSSDDNSTSGVVPPTDYSSTDLEELPFDVNEPTLISDHPRSPLPLHLRHQSSSSLSNQSPVLAHHIQPIGRVDDPIIIQSLQTPSFLRNYTPDPAPAVGIQCSPITKACADKAVQCQAPAETPMKVDAASQTLSTGDVWSQQLYTE